jgi:Uri superfamily endonuclease
MVSFERGTYVLVLRLTHHRTMRVGSLGRLRFARGYYAYVGSARRGMRSRVARHLSRKKKKRWHIDWLTTQPSVVPIAVASTTLTGVECKIALLLSNGADGRVDGFGCSDCECESHFFYFLRVDDLFSALNVRASTLSTPFHSKRRARGPCNPCSRLGQWIVCSVNEQSALTEKTKSNRT